jgi:hypothetical protein
MDTQLQKWIGKNRDKILELKLWKTISKYITKETGETVSASEVFDLIYPDKVHSCSNAKFRCFSIGYVSCKKGCDCYKKQLSEKISTIKLSYSDSKKEQILNTRINTVQERYGVSNTFVSEESKKKIAQTKLEKYGDSTFVNVKQRTETVKTKYGVENVMQVPEFAKKCVVDRNWVEINEKVSKTKHERYGDSGFNNSELRKQTNVGKYGVENAAKSDQIRSKISEKLRDIFVPQHSKKYNITPLFNTAEYVPSGENTWKCNSCGSILSGIILNGAFTRCKTCHPYGSVPENQIKDFIRSYGFTVIENSRKIIAPYEIDIYIPEKKIAIEYCGTYWHTEQHGKDKGYHFNKLKMCNDAGIRLITLFSDHWIFNKEICKSRLLHYLSVPSVKIYARNTTVSNVPNDESRKFLMENHIQGYCNSKIKYGLYFENKLVALMTFSQSRFKAHEYELVRFATKTGTSVVGGASKLLSHYLKNNAETTLVTYSDNNWGYTQFYEKIGFTKVGSVPPGYSYLDLNTGNPKLQNRMQFQKHKLSRKMDIFLEDATEYEIMLANGYDKVWNCGQTKYQIIR